MKSETVIRDIHTRIYSKLLKVIPDLLTIHEHGKSEVEGFMDLGLDVLQRKPDRSTGGSVQHGLSDAIDVFALCWLYGAADKR